MKSSNPIYPTSEIEYMYTGANELLKQKAYQDEPLDFEEAYALGAFTLYSLGNEELADSFEVDSETASVQSVAALCSFHNSATYDQEGAAEQIAGINAAVMDYDIGDSLVSPDVDLAMDNCGTGGDTYRTMNVSTLAALTAASDPDVDINMCKHGSPGNTDSTGSSDFLEHLGFDLQADTGLTERGVEEEGFGYTDALNTDYKDIHVQTHRKAQLAHMNDIIGPITNPLESGTHRKRMVGVNHLMEPETVTKAYYILNERGITEMDEMVAVRGFIDETRNGGIDEASTMSGGTKFARLSDGEIETGELMPEDFGLEPTDYDEINPDQYPMSKAEFSRQIAAGEINNGAQDLVAANAALLYSLTGEEEDLEAGTTRARELLEDGRPLETAEEAAAISRGDRV